MLLAWLKQTIRNHFGFSRAETYGVLLLACLIIIFLTLPPVVRWYYNKHGASNHTADVALLESTLALLEQQRTKQASSPKHSEYGQPIGPHSNPKGCPPDNDSVQSFNANTATVSQLQQLTGIGPVLATRIIRYRNKLGGFVSKAQYQEIYGLGSSALAHLTKHTYILPDFQPRQLHINTDDFKTLLTHPYLSYEQVQRIIHYRSKHRKLHHVAELTKESLLDKATFERIYRYISLS